MVNCHQNPCSFPGTPQESGVACGITFRHHQKNIISVESKVSWWNFNKNEAAQVLSGDEQMLPAF